jgi:hypothetical protein
MPEATTLERAIAAIASDLAALGHRFALVGGLAVSVRAEVRFTRDVDVAALVPDDRKAEALVLGLRGRGYRAVATVEHESQKRLSTARLLSALGVKVDLLFASSGIEDEVVSRATSVHFPGVGDIPVARVEELLALKILSMSESRLQDRIDARDLLRFNPGMDMGAVRGNLREIRERGYHRGQDLDQKLASVGADMRR